MITGIDGSILLLSTFLSATTFVTSGDVISFFSTTALPIGEKASAGHGGHRKTAVWDIEKHAKTKCLMDVSGDWKECSRTQATVIGGN